MVFIAFQASLLFLFWVALSGVFDSFHLGVGALTAASVAILCRPRKTDDKIKLSAVEYPLFLLRSLRYLFWLLYQIFLAALHVSKVILKPQLNIEPKIITHKTILKGNFARTLFANSITLTPGTMTVKIDGDLLTIHEIDRASSEGIRSGEMETEILKIYGGKQK